MKRIIYTIISVLTISAGIGIYTSPITYEKSGYIIEVEQPNKENPQGLVTFEDIKGDVWTFPGSDDWLPGDLLTVKMSDNGTDFSFDDYIIITDGSAQAIYNGSIPEDFQVGKNYKKYLF